MPQALGDFWSEVKEHAESMCTEEPIMRPLLQQSVLQHTCLEAALVDLLSRQLADTITFEAWVDVLSGVYNDSHGKYEDKYGSLGYMAMMDLKGVLERDPSCQSLVQCFLYFKGFKALQAHRVAHVLWRQDRRSIALYIQSRCASIYAVDIHPAATIGPGLMMDHATGIVIGETAEVGSNCSFLHGVTLGATGKAKGDRHPKLGDDVLIGCNASILGNIRIGHSCKIGSGSIVLKGIPNRTTAVGNPARVVGKCADEKPANEMDHGLQNVISPCGQFFLKTWSLWIDGNHIFDDVETDERGRISLSDAHAAWLRKAGIENSCHQVTLECLDRIFSELDVNKDGMVNASALEKRLLEVARDKSDEMYTFDI